jgi:hypothetical protein
VLHKVAFFVLYRVVRLHDLGTADFDLSADEGHELHLGFFREPIHDRFKSGNDLVDKFVVWMVDVAQDIVKILIRNLFYVRSSCAAVVVNHV